MIFHFPIPNTIQLSIQYNTIQSHCYTTEFFCLSVSFSRPERAHSSVATSGFRRTHNALHQRLFGRLPNGVDGSRRGRRRRSRRRWDSGSRDRWWRRDEWPRRVPLRVRLHVTTRRTLPHVVVFVFLTLRSVRRPVNGKQPDGYREHL